MVKKTTAPGAALDTVTVTKGDAKAVINAADLDDWKGNGWSQQGAVKEVPMAEEPRAASLDEFLNYTKPELAAMLQDAGIGFPSNAVKADMAQALVAVGYNPEAAQSTEAEADDDVEEDDADDDGEE